MKKEILLACLLPLLAACLQNGQAGGKTDWAGIAQDMFGAYTAKGADNALTDAQIGAGLKEALGIGTANVVKQLGATGGFELDPKVHIPLPASMQKVDAALKLAGMNGLTQELESRMNRAAELATPKAKQLFVGAIKQMGFSDARHILTGGQQDAATQFFRRTMGEALARDIQPIIQSTLAESGAIKAFDAMTARYDALPMTATLASTAKSDLNSYVSTKAVDGIFYYVAKEEAAIRQNPAKRTTDLLKQVFGGQ